MRDFSILSKDWNNLTNIFGEKAVALKFLGVLGNLKTICNT